MLLLLTIKSSQERSLGTSIATSESRVRRNDSARLKVQIATVTNMDPQPSRDYPIGKTSALRLQPDEASPGPPCSFCPFLYAFVDRASNLTSGFSFRHVILQNLGPRGGCS